MSDKDRMAITRNSPEVLDTPDFQGHRDGHFRCHSQKLLTANATAQITAQYIKPKQDHADIVNGQHSKLIPRNGQLW